MTVVVPPMAAERVAVSNVSAFIWPMPDICSIWQCGSTPPGVTIRPVASRVSVPTSRAEGCDPAAGNGDIGGENRLGRGHLAALDDQIVPI
jgi:hypothetical protein